jgi:hypothetical protein
MNLFFTLFCLTQLICLFFIWLGWGFELRVSHLISKHSTTWVRLPALFCMGYFRGRILRTTFPRWLQIMIPLISAFWIARITDMSHRHLALLPFFITVPPCLGFETSVSCSIYLSGVFFPHFFVFLVLEIEISCFLDKCFTWVQSAAFPTQPNPLFGFNFSFS